MCGKQVGCANRGLIAGGAVLGALVGEWEVPIRLMYKRIYGYKHANADAMLPCTGLRDKCSALMFKQQAGVPQCRCR